MSKIIKVCEQCGKQYMARRERQRYCSKPCQYAATRTRVTMACEICGKSFSETPYRIAHGKGRFCSRKCYAAWQSQTMSGEASPFWNGGSVIVVCEQCGKEMKLDPSHASGRRFCSIECASIGARNGEERACLHCGQTFYTAPSTNKRYCSHECHNQANSGANNYRWNGGMTSAACEYCGNIFEVYPYRIAEGGGRYCSRACANIATAKGGEDSPLWQGGKSFEPYPPTFNGAFKRTIRERDDHRCAICRLPARAVHHINYVKDDTDPGNCITLCKRCHSKTNYHRAYWQRALSGLLSARFTGASL